MSEFDKFLKVLRYLLVMYCAFVACGVLMEFLFGLGLFRH